MAMSGKKIKHALLGTGVSVMVGGVFAIAGGVAALSIVASAPVSVPALTIVGAVAAVMGGVIASSGGAAATAVGATFCSSKDGQSASVSSEKQQQPLLLQSPCIPNNPDPQSL